MAHEKLEPSVRVGQILDAAVTLAETYGYQDVTRLQIATLAGCSPGLVSKHFGTLGALRRAIMGAAIQRRNLNIIAQGLAAAPPDPRASRAPEELRRLAAESIIGG